MLHRDWTLSNMRLWWPEPSEPASNFSSRLVFPPVGWVEPPLSSSCDSFILCVCNLMLKWNLLITMNHMDSFDFLHKDSWPIQLTSTVDQYSWPADHLCLYLFLFFYPDPQIHVLQTVFFFLQLIPEVRLGNVYLELITGQFILFLLRKIMIWWK